MLYGGVCSKDMFANFCHPVTHNTFRVHLRCDRCNNKLTDSDWSKFKSEGWDVEIVKHCSPCIDSMASALAQSTRPHEFTDVE